MFNLTTFAEANKALEQYWPKYQPKRLLRSREHMERLMDFLHNPQNNLHVVHVAGTSGKTSTAYYVAALLRETGASVGLSISPYMTEVNERVQHNLEPLPEETFCRDLGTFLDLVVQSGARPHYFEVVIAFAYWWYARAGVDYVVMETGMGGLLDPTNVVDREDKVCVITDIGLDHMNVLGRTITDIAEHKAGIVQLHNAVFCHRQEQAILDVIMRRCRQKQADLYVLDKDHAPFDDQFLPLFQQRNFALAHAAAAYVAARDGRPMRTAELQRAAHIQVPGRMEQLTVQGKTVVLDTAHNPQKMQLLAASLRHQFGDAPMAALVSFAPGVHRATNNVRQLAPVAEHMILTAFGDKDSPFLSIRQDDMLQAAKSARLPSYAYQEDAYEGLRTLLKRPEPVVVITGSLFLVARLRPLLSQMAQTR